MPTIKELSARLAATGQLTPEELTAFDTATGPTATAQAQESVLDMLVKKVEATKGGSIGNSTSPTSTATQPAQAATGQPAPQAQAPTEAEWLASAPPSVRAIVQRAAAQEQARKTALIASIRTAATASEQANVFTDEELATFPIEHLQKLAALAGVINNPSSSPANTANLAYDYTGAGAMFPDAPRTNVIQPVPDPYESALAGRRAAGQKTN